MEKQSELGSREVLQSSVDPPVHQHDKDGGAGSRQGGIKGLPDVDRKKQESNVGKQLGGKDVTLVEANELRDNRIVSEEGGLPKNNREFGVGEDMGEEGFPLGNRKVEKWKGISAIGIDRMEGIVNEER